jgi:hypothetical protein
VTPRDPLPHLFVFPQLLGVAPRQQQQHRHAQGDEGCGEEPLPDLREQAGRHARRQSPQPAPQVGQADQQHDAAPDEHRPAPQPRVQRLPALAEEVAQQRHRRCPQDRAEGVGQQEARPGHGGSSCREGRHHAQAGHETAQHDCQAAVAREVPLDGLQRLRRQDQEALALEDAFAGPVPADPEAQIVAEHRGEGGDQDDAGQGDR